MNVLLLGGGRLEKIGHPLAAVGVTCYTNQDDVPWRDIDVVLTDTPGTTLLRGAAVKFALGVPLIYRMRGNYWKEMADLPFGAARTTLSNEVLFRLCDGICTPGEHIEAELREQTGFEGPTTSIEVPKDVDEYPPVEHDSQNYDLLTLTNFDYKEKIQPLYRFVDAVDEYLSTTCGTWWIAGDGRFSEEFAIEIAGYENVEYLGFVDPHDYLPRSALLLHFSEFEGSSNAILEGLASGLPVITNEYPPFVRNPETIVVSDGEELRERLDQLCRDPEQRSEIGQCGREYVQAEHSYEAIGNDLRRFIERTEPRLASVE